MPNRVIREALLDSKRYWALSNDGKIFFIHMMLLADDFGCISLAPLFIARRAFIQRPGPAKLEALIRELADQDLVRLYFAGDIKTPERYAFIPRFGQTLKWKKARLPMPPRSLFSDDKAAQKKFIENKELFSEMESGRTTPGGDPEPEVGVGVGVGTEKVLVLNPAQPPAAGTETTLPPPPADASASIENSQTETRGYRQRAAEMGLTQNPGETDAAFMVRTMQTANQRKRA